MYFNPRFLSEFIFNFTNLIVYKFILYHKVEYLNVIYLCILKILILLNIQT